MTYHSQDGQDKIIHELLFDAQQYKGNGVFVEIGAHDGVHISNTYFFERQLGWQGVLIEPRPDAFARLVANRSATALNCCVGKKSGKVLFVSAGLLSGILKYYSPTNLERIEKEYLKRSETPQLIWVDVRTIDDILSAHGITRVNLLSIDIEGAELDILRMIDFHKVEVDVILCEDNGGSLGQLREYLRTCGYVMFKRVGADGIFVRRAFLEHKGLDGTRLNNFRPRGAQARPSAIGNIIPVTATEPVDWLSGSWAAPDKWGTWVDGLAASAHMRLDPAPDPKRTYEWIVSIRGVRTGASNEVCETIYSVNGAEVLRLDYSSSPLPLFQHVPVAGRLLTETTVLGIQVRRMLVLADGQRQPLDDLDISLHVSAFQLVDIVAHAHSCAMAVQLAFAVSKAGLTLPMLGVGWQPPDKAGVQAIGNRQTLRIPAFPEQLRRFLALGFNELRTEVASTISFRLDGRSVNHHLLQVGSPTASGITRHRVEACIDLRSADGSDPPPGEARWLEILTSDTPSAEASSGRPYHLATAVFSDHGVGDR
jgi:FkbM family methyltransferase